MRTLVVGALLASLSSSGCYEPSSPSDAGTDADTAVDAALGPVAPVSPAAPAPPGPLARVCPIGWVAAGTGCAPFDVEPRCSGAEALIPGERGCTEVGAACPTGSFAAPPASGEVLYVSATATAPGDGSASAPYDALWRAVDSASAGTTILLSKGEHVGEADLPAGVHLAGACAAETTLRPTGPAPMYPTLLISGGDVEISNLTIAGERPGVFAVGAAASATLSGVVIDGVPGLGLLAQGGTLDATEVIVRGTRTDSGLGGRGIDAIRDGTLTLSRASIEGSATGGTLIASGATATLTDVSYVDCGERAVNVQAGATVRLTRVAMLRVREVALNANDPGTTITAADVFYSGDPGGEDRAVGAGVGGTIDAEGVYVTGIGENAVFATDADTAITLADAIFVDVGGRGLNAQRGASIVADRVVADDVRDVIALASSGGTVRVSDLTGRGGGRALRAQTGGALTATRVSLVDLVEDAVQSSNEGTTVVVEDLDARMGTPEMVPARGAAAFSGSDLTLRRATVTGAVWAGASVFDAATTARLEDVAISGVEPYHDGTAGYGLAVLEGTLVADRVRVERAHTMGVGLAFGASATLRDITVTATRPEPATGLWGRAISSQGPNDGLTVERGVFEESVAVGVFAAGESSFEMRDVVVRTARRRDCTVGTCIEEGGVGVVAYYGGAIRLESFLLTENDVAGAQLGEGGELDFLDGVVSDQPIGVSIQTSGYDVGRLTDQVRYENNGSNLDTDALPVPSESMSIVPTDEPPED